MTTKDNMPPLPKTWQERMYEDEAEKGYCRPHGYYRDGYEADLRATIASRDARVAELETKVKDAETYSRGVLTACEHMRGQIAELQAALAAARQPVEGGVQTSPDTAEKPVVEGENGGAQLGQPVEAEPVAWFTEDHLTDKSATTWDHAVAERWRAKGWPVGALVISGSAQQPAMASPPAGEARDGERLDWMLTHFRSHFKLGNGESCIEYTINEFDYNAIGANPRAAIDAAMAQQEKQG